MRTSTQEDPPVNTETSPIKMNNKHHHQEQEELANHFLPEPEEIEDLQATREIEVLQATMTETTTLIK
jgi:hypothetical protein